MTDEKFEKIKESLDNLEQPYILITMSTSDITSKNIQYKTITNINVPTFFQNILADVLNGIKNK